MEKVLSRPWALATLVLSVAFTAVTACVHVLSFHAPALDEPEITIVILVLVVTLFLLWIPAVSVVVERAKAAGLTSGVQDFTGLLFRSTPPPVRRIVMAVAAYAFLLSVLDAGIFALHLNPAIPLSAVFLAFSSIASGILWGAAWEPKRAA
jgi:hypothetical protein